jgi:peroxiredoxin
MNAPGEASIGGLQKPRGSSRAALIATTVALMVSVTLNVLLAHRVSSLIHWPSPRIADAVLKVGTSVLPIAAKRLDGRRELISYQQLTQPTVLYVFTPPCPWCARNLDNLKVLMDEASGQYRFIGVSLSQQGLAEYLEKNDLKLPVYSDLTPETLKAYKLGSTPQTIVISPQGKVLQDWVGAYVGDQKSQVEAFFHVNLPGLRELPKAKAMTN